MTKGASVFLNRLSCSSQLFTHSVVTRSAIISELAIKNYCKGDWMTYLVLITGEKISKWVAICIPYGMRNICTSAICTSVDTEDNKTSNRRRLFTDFNNNVLICVCVCVRAYTRERQRDSVYKTVYTDVLVIVARNEYQLKQKIKEQRSCCTQWVCSWTKKRCKICKLMRIRGTENRDADSKVDIHRRRMKFKEVEEF